LSSNEHQFNHQCRLARAAFCSVVKIKKEALNKSLEMDSNKNNEEEGKL
jgi:hypothetical protein